MFVSKVMVFFDCRYLIHLNYGHSFITWWRYQSDLTKFHIFVDRSEGRLNRNFVWLHIRCVNTEHFMNSAGRLCLVGKAEHTKVPDYNRFSAKKGCGPLHNAVRENTRCRWVYIAYGRVILQRKIEFIVLAKMVGRYTVHKPSSYNGVSKNAQRYPSNHGYMGL